jgi:glycosyltransferase involved in cell wall biosynthesis
MRVVHINTHDTGGAAIAAYRLHQGLVKEGIFDSSFLVLYNSARYSDVKTFRPRFGEMLWKKIKLKIQNRKSLEIPRDIEIFSSPNTIYNALSSELVQKADIIHLHWVANFIDYQTFFRKIKKPIVWTFHDENPFSGGFHYSIDRSFASPLLKTIDKNLERIKYRSLSASGDYNIITPTQWLKEKSNQTQFSDIFKNISVIKYGLDETQFTLFGEKAEAKKILKLSAEKLHLLIIATNFEIYRKGFDIIKSIITDALHAMPDIQFLLAGTLQESIESPNVTCLGFIDNAEQLNVAYNAADAMLLSSREDNLPNVMIESLMCGTPVIGFSIGGIGEIIAHGVNGLLARQTTGSALLEVIKEFKLVHKSFSPKAIRQHAVDNFNLSRQAKMVSKVYETVVHEHDKKWKKRIPNGVR